jgi:acetyl-CoA synthetase
LNLRWYLIRQWPKRAVVGATDATTGQAIFAYVTLRTGMEVPESELRAHVTKEIGAIAKPKQIYFTPELPKTRSEQDHASFDA